MDLNELGYLRVAACAPEIALADPARNAEVNIAAYRRLVDEGAALVLFPELATTGYSCEDLFLTEPLLRANHAALLSLARSTSNTGAVLVVGAPWLTADARLLNCAFVCANGKVMGAVPKCALPNHGEFYDGRWFCSGHGLDETVDDPSLGEFRIAQPQLFQVGSAWFGIEICEDLWAPQPTGNALALAGADIILNPSASNELVAKADYRRDLVRMASGQRICGYLYASSGATESTKDVVYGGHLIAAENGQVLGESERFGLAERHLISEFDWQKLRHDRAWNKTFAGSERSIAHHRINCEITPAVPKRLRRRYPAQPFVPADEHEFDARAQEIMSIQATGLARRVRSANTRKLVLGLSGGLDSSLALLVCLDALAVLDVAPDAILALTMPGPGTTEHTLDNARDLATAASVTLKEVPIAAALQQHLKDLEHPPDEYDVVFENAQARERTQLLFNYANKVDGLVVGTGDLSELALGWCTFNADHMASYNVNAGVPKTLIAYLVRWYARHRADPALSKVLKRVLDTPISPELLPPDDGAISQRTEEIVGPYPLHDFFLYHYVRNGFGPEKIFTLARESFASEYDAVTVKRWLRVFFSRFTTQQFKRTTLPPGPKVGTVSLSPRGDWRMPDEAGAEALLRTIDALDTTDREA
jgi:NAD+ synthase (glutamine-hydrolysing)